MKKLFLATAGTLVLAGMIVAIAGTCSAGAAFLGFTAAVAAAFLGTICGIAAGFNVVIPVSFFWGKTWKDSVDSATTKAIDKAATIVIGMVLVGVAWCGAQLSPLALVGGIILGFECLRQMGYFEDEGVSIKKLLVATGTTLVITGIIIAVAAAGSLAGASLEFVAAAGAGLLGIICGVAAGVNLVTTLSFLVGKTWSESVDTAITIALAVFLVALAWVGAHLFPLAFAGGLILGFDFLRHEGFFQDFK
ncbi:MAG: hypothetical protein P4L53_03705 [Candidatus Obscuribacterales bacterium]|nr:hypothetical protein [Candidatus Obscuribacterales bacterium]